MISSRLSAIITGQSMIEKESASPQADLGERAQAVKHSLENWQTSLDLAVLLSLGSTLFDMKTAKSI